MSSNNGSSPSKAARLEKDRAWLREWASGPFRRSSTIARAAETAKGAPSEPTRRRLIEALTAAVERADQGEPDEWVETFLGALDVPPAQLVPAEDEQPKEPEFPAPPPLPELPADGQITRDTIVEGYRGLRSSWAYLRKRAEWMLATKGHSAAGVELLGSVLEKEKGVLREMARAVGADRMKEEEERRFPAYVGPQRGTIQELITKQGWTHDGADIYELEDSPVAPPQR